MKLPFTDRDGLDGLGSALAGSASTNLSRVRQWLTVVMFSLPPIRLISCARCCVLTLT